MWARWLRTIRWHLSLTILWVKDSNPGEVTALWTSARVSTCRPSTVTSRTHQQIIRETWQRLPVSRFINLNLAISLQSSMEVTHQGNTETVLEVCIMPRYHRPEGIFKKITSRHPLVALCAAHPFSTLLRLSITASTRTRKQPLATEIRVPTSFHKRPKLLPFQKFCLWVVIQSPRLCSLLTDSK